MSNATSSGKQVFTDKMTECACCGKQMYVQSRTSYSYKAVNKNGFVRYFCSWKCFNVGCTEIKKSRKSTL